MEKRKVVVDIRNVVTRLPELQFTSPVNWTIEEGQQWAIVGPNGAGKTLLADMMQRKFAFREGEVSFASDAKLTSFIKSIAFKDLYSLADLGNSYYQQRWHQTEADDVPLVKDLLQAYWGSESLAKILRLFNIEDLLPKKIIFLSSGELRKFLIVRTLLSNPRILILDNPFIGLDASSRELLKDTLAKITEVHNIQVVLVLSNPNDIPPMITHVQPVLNKTCLSPCTRAEFLANGELLERLFPTEKASTINLPVDPEKKASTHAVTLRMEKIHVKYGERVILQDLDWEIKNGEKWALCGPNGAGKSTLLSLVCADNPQSYANTFYLFDRKRGSGESIWDIKKRIGYISPEMHIYYKENVSALKIVSSGFFDSIGLYRTCNAEQERLALEWMKVFGVEHLRERLFMTLSTGEQRLVLLARAFVKDPDLIILDEPLHGLDVSGKRKVIGIIERFCERLGKTLIYVTHYLEELPSCVSSHFELRKN